MNLRWSTDTGAAGYQLQYAKDKDFSADGAQTMDFKAGQNSAVLEKLTEKATYYVRMRGSMAVGSSTKYGPWSEVKSLQIAETVKLPANIIGWLDGRSSLARLGLMVHVTAHRIDPGWEGKIVLEFYNSGKLPLALRPNMVIGALSFEVLSGPAARPYISRKDAKYKHQQNAVASRINED